MKKIFIVFSVVLTLSFFGCAEADNKVYDIDISKMAADISAEFDASVELTRLTEQSVNDRYGLKGLFSEIYAEASVAISADEFVVIKAIDEESAKQAYDMLDKYRKERADLFRTYAPDESPKLEKALLDRAGEYVFFVACEDTSSAEKIWKEYKSK
ncbi:MAG: DUF4358 domain-containing protein [Clostridia bacterium]|nr:DUF4358 domain-containing protein [Clostridia bacterium]